MNHISLYSSYAKVTLTVDSKIMRSLKLLHTTVCLHKNYVAFTADQQENGMKDILVVCNLARQHRIFH